MPLDLDLICLVKGVRVDLCFSKSLLQIFPFLWKGSDICSM